MPVMLFGIFWLLLSNIVHIAVDNVDIPKQCLHNVTSIPHKSFLSLALTTPDTRSPQSLPTPTAMPMFSFVPSAQNNDSMSNMLQNTEQLQNTSTIDTTQGYSLEDLRDYGRFSKLFVEKRKLGAGADGAVYEYEHVYSKALVAVKRPHGLQPTPVSQLIAEIDSLMSLGNHPHLASMITFSMNFEPRGPAIFLEVCELGDVHSYRKMWLDQQYKRGKSERPHEATVWKLLKDMSLALDYMHTKLPKVYVHNDVKPANILVTFPSGWKLSDGIPVEPVFKLTDFARMVSFPNPPNTNPDSFIGTWEYSPNGAENLTMRPSRDIWALGGTLQRFALGIDPVQSRQAFVFRRQFDRKPYPNPRDRGAWNRDEVRRDFKRMYRPLNATVETLMYQYDVADPPSKAWIKAYRPYSDTLNAWYQMLFQPLEAERITAASLVEHCVPLIDNCMSVAYSTNKASEAFAKAEKMREQIRLRRAGKKVDVKGKAGDMRAQRPPSYEGNAYGGFPL
jgi:serine/threonine protein kinase